MYAAKAGGRRTCRFFVPEMDMGTTIVTEILDHDATVPEIQLPPED